MMKFYESSGCMGDKKSAMRLVDATTVLASRTICIAVVLNAGAAMDLLTGAFGGIRHRIRVEHSAILCKNW